MNKKSIRLSIPLKDIKVFHIEFSRACEKKDPMAILDLLLPYLVIIEEK